MPEYRIDPIEYAWTECNPRVEFPLLLARKLTRDPSLRPGEEALDVVKQTHTQILRRAPRRWRVPATSAQIERNDVN